MYFWQQYSYTAIVQSYSDAQQPATSGVALFEVYDLRTSSSGWQCFDAGTGRYGWQHPNWWHHCRREHVEAGGDSRAWPDSDSIRRRWCPAKSLSRITRWQRNLVEANNDWQQSPEAAAIIADGKAPSNVRESAMARTLSPGNYTALVSGAGGTTGTGLIEIYDESLSP